MPLARGASRVQQYDGDAHAPPQSDAVLIAIAPAAHDRVRLAALVSGHAPLLLVSSAEEAVAFLGMHEQPEAAVPRPSPAHRAPDPPREIAGLHIDSDRRLASWAGQTTGLSPLEHDLLVRLVSRPGHLWTFGRLHQEVWGTAHLGSGADVHSVVKRLRRKLRQLGSPLEIETIRGVGLRLVEL
jgi:DNA-binding response OmpR family regulator